MMIWRRTYRCRFVRELPRHTGARGAFWQIPPLNQQFQHPDPDSMSLQGWYNVRYRWFSLHAAVAIEGGDRAGLRQLFHYGARSSVNLSLPSYAQPDDPGRSGVQLSELVLMRVNYIMPPIPWNKKLAPILSTTTSRDLIKHFGALHPIMYTRSPIRA